MRLGTLARSAGAAAILAGVALLTYAGVVVFTAHAYQHLVDVSPSAPETTGRSFARRPIVEGDVIGEIRVERIGLRTVITQGETDAILDLGAGHLADTPWLDESGNVVLAGHRDTVFRPLEHIRVGDVMEVTGQLGLIRYAVTPTSIVDPTDLTVLPPSDGKTLTRITYFPFVYVGHAPQRFVVRASAIQ